eukprot:TRINITY_DN79479_c0_g1_i1.p1 TRINITY_DN79479_c0_g1~~TRINITY_DN79479_c0_g1_i1.p1  ORF type:complete len:140 (-),score=18.73 TRINITY_DN79479_c0_g1_i1:125-544(-)
MSGITRTISNYNPLNGTKPLAEDIWVCIQEGANFYKAPSLTADLTAAPVAQSDDGTTTATTTPIGAEVIGKREGDWIKLHDAEIYVPARGPDGVRYFKNKKLILWEESQKDADAPTRRPSNLSIGTKSNDGSKSNCSVM